MPQILITNKLQKRATLIIDLSGIINDKFCLPCTEHHEHIETNFPDVFKILELMCLTLYLRVVSD